MTLSFKENIKLSCFWIKKVQIFMVQNVHFLFALFFEIKHVDERATMRWLHTWISFIREFENSALAVAEKVVRYELLLSQNNEPTGCLQKFQILITIL